MSTVIGLFDNEDSLQTAISQLEAAEYDDDIIEVVTNASRADGSGAVVPAAAMAATGQSGGQGAAVAVVGLKDAATRALDGLGDEGNFFKEAAADGGKLIIIKTSSDAEVESILENAGASRVYSE